MKKLLNSVVSMVTWMVVALLAGGVSSVLAAGAGQQPSQGQKLANAAEHQNMQLVGTNDLQARSTYQPSVHHYADGRYILFAGHHALGTNPVTGHQLPSFNPLTGKNEPNGTSIVDVTDPKHPVYLFHIPVGAPVTPPALPTNGGAQYDQRICDGSTLPIHDSKVYLLRSFSNSAHEIWNVTNPGSPTKVVDVITGLAGTHKSWWECDTGIAYIVGRRSNDTPGWKAGNHVFIMDLSNPASPVFLRDWALDGQQPGGVIPPNFNAIPSIHGPISTGPSSTHVLPGNSPNPIAGTGATLDRVYFAYGTGSNGVMQVVDRTKLLPPPWGTGVTCGSAASSTLPAPSCASPTTSYTTAEIGRWVMNPINGAHTSYPIGKIAIPDFEPNAVGTVRDFVVVTSEETSNQCGGPRHLTYMVDVTEFTITATGATVSHPQSQANFQVPESDGEFCDRGGRFGPHSTQEEFGPPFYQKVVFVAYFNAGVRAVDVRDPFNPQEVAFYIPATTANTDYRCTNDADPTTCKIAIQTNNLATDDRGYIYIADRADTGVHILQLTGPGLDPLK
jgi:hypothetical protein